MISRINKLAQYRARIFSFFNKRKDAVMNLLDAISSHAHQARSVVQLSEAPCFERQYSSITKAISKGLPTVDWKSIEKETYRTLFDSEEKEPPCFILDCTCNPRPFSKKLADRTITHQPNPAPGNKPICVGHQYSCVTVLPSDILVRDKKWLIPISMNRIDSNQKGNEAGIDEVLRQIKIQGLEDDLVISVGDTLYGSEACRKKVSASVNLVHLFRLNSRRNVYCLPEVSNDLSSNSGRPKEYGAKVSLSDPKSLPEPDIRSETGRITRKGKINRVLIDRWESMLLRGSKQYSGSRHPITLIRVRVVDKDGKDIFKKPMWIGMLGQRRRQITSISAYSHYRSRYSIEHFFRFGKTKLLLDAHQTPEVSHEEDWWRLCMIAYNQLYLANSIVSKIPKPWERHLPEYQHESEKCFKKITTPSQTQRGFANLLQTIGTPASECTPRGRSQGRIKGETGVKRPNTDIIFKTKKTAQSGKKIINADSEHRHCNANLKEIKNLLQGLRDVIQRPYHYGSPLVIIQNNTS